MAAQAMGLAALENVLATEGPRALAAANTRLWFMQWRMTAVVGRAEAAEERGRLISGRIAELGRAWADYAEDLRRLLRDAENRAADARGLNRLNGFRWADAENRAAEAQERTDAAVARAAAAEARAAAAEERAAVAEAAVRAGRRF